MNARALLVVTVMSCVVPAVAAGQDAGAGITIQGAVGPQINVSGNSQSLSFGFVPGERFEFLVSAERMHVPTEIRRYDYSSGVTRGGTTRFISGEVRFSPLTVKRISPYVLAGGGRGTSRPNVNDLFPDGVSHDAMLLFTGGGVRVPVTRHLSAFADVRFVLQVDSSEAGVFLFQPVRGGLAWRF
jgi:hypothetical protein